MAVVILLLTTIAGFTQEVDDIPEDSIPTGSFASDSIFAISNDVEPLIEDHSSDSDRQPRHCLTCAARFG